MRGKAHKILEIGVGTGPNLKYYANDPGIHVFGIDPNSKMKKYALVAAEAAGLQPSNFEFMQAVRIFPRNSMILIRVLLSSMFKSFSLKLSL